MIKEPLPAPVKILESQRLEMAKLCNILVAAIREQACKYVIRCVLMSIEKQCLESFREEENLIKAYGYSGYTRHTEEHIEFLAAVSGLISRAFTQGPRRQCASYELTVEAVQLLADWRRGHIEGANRDFEAFCSGSR